MYKWQIKHKYSRRQWLLSIVAILIIIFAVVLILLLSDVIKFGGTTSNGSTTQNDTATINSNSNQEGGAVDMSQTAADATLQTNQSDWLSSDSGTIILQQPINGAILKSGDVVIGTSVTATVQYRLEDDRVGVIAQGSLSVVDGRFSGILHFTSVGTAGELDIFTFDPMSGAEINHVDINVGFAD